MKCPNCGEEMAEGNLYCEHCGEDIHIVPDFEPELEKSIERTMELAISDIRKVLNQMEDEPSDPEEPEEEEGEDGETPRPRKRYVWKILLGTALVLFAAALAAGVRIYQYHSEEYQTDRANRYTAEGLYDKAITCYGRALELDPDNIELQFGLAEVYFLKNNKIEYEYLLREIVKNENATLEQLDRAYGKLIAIYRAREDFNTINELLKASNDEQLKLTYQNYMASPPEFSITEGYYASIQALKLTAYGSGKIYYTLDGSVPDENSTPYTTPIILEDGDYVVSAVFINDNGISSEAAVKEYHIENDEIPEPQISTVSGEYSYPVYIEVIGDDDEIYYTTDGSDPTYSSPVYSGPIPMPLGRSVFKFAKIEDGIVGDIAEKTYNLRLNTEYTPEQAVADVVEFNMTGGKIFDAEGHFDESGDRYIYEYQYVTNINKINDFYVIAEIYQTADGTLTKTGNNFAVNVYTGERFKLQRDERGRFSLIEIEIKEDS